MPYVTEDNLTDVVLERWKDIPDPRLRQIMQSLMVLVQIYKTVCNMRI